MQVRIGSLQTAARVTVWSVTYALVGGLAIANGLFGWPVQRWEAIVWGGITLLWMSTANGYRKYYKRALLRTENHIAAHYVVQPEKETEKITEWNEGERM